MTRYEELEPGQRDTTADTPVTDTNLKSALLNHVCFNITHPDRSLAFFREVLGFSLLFSWNIGPQTVFFMGHKEEGQSQEEFLKGMQRSQGLIELLWMHDSRPAMAIATPVAPNRVGFFHVGITVDNVQDVIDKAVKFGVQCIKPLGRPQDLTQMGFPHGVNSPLAEQCYKVLNKVAFISDPDGNWIELVPTNIVSAGWASHSSPSQ